MSTITFFRGAYTTIAIALLVLLLPLQSSATGVFVPPWPDRIYQSDQEAIVYLHDGIEDLILTSKFRGNAENFAWIVATPSVPTVERASWETFVALRELTRVAEDDYVISGYGIAEDYSLSASKYAPEPKVEEVESKSLGYYDITVLEANDADALLQWFTDNGFTYPTDGRFVLEDYIAAGWVFTAIRFDTDDISDATTDAVTKANTIPLHFTFKTDTMVIPMAMAQVARMYSTDEPVEGDTRTFPKRPVTVDTTLYLIARSKQSLPGFEEEYAGYISGKSLSTLSYQVDGTSTLKTAGDEQLVLTRLDRSFPVSEMTYDLYPREEENKNLLNDKQAAEKKEFLLWGLLGLAGILVVVLIGAIILISKDPKKGNE